MIRPHDDVKCKVFCRALNNFQQLPANTSNFHQHRKPSLKRKLSEYYRMNNPLTILIAAGLLGSALYAGHVTAESIVLNDGSRIQGRILSLTDGHYRVQTESLGVISLRQSEVQNISSGVATDSNTAGSSDIPVGSLQSNIVNNAGLMSSVMSLQNDPDMQAVLADPEVMRLVQAMDFAALANHPKIKKLMSNPQIKNIQSQVK